MLDQASGDSIEDMTLDDLVERASCVLPEQGPLPAFVHHNTLHHFEHLPFERGVVEGARLLGGEPYQSEAAFIKHLLNGRITPRDVDAVLNEELPAPHAPILPGAPSQHAFWKFRLRQTFQSPRSHALEWLLHEQGQLSTLHACVSPKRAKELRDYANARFVDARSPLAAYLEHLWAVLQDATPTSAHATPVSPRQRDQLLTSHGIDTDHVVHPRLIRFVAAYLDQGVAYWTMPERERGMLHAFRLLYGQTGEPTVECLRGLSAELRRQHAAQWDAKRTIAWALEQLDVPRTQWLPVVQATLYSLRGWAGMVRQFERKPGSAPTQALPARLDDYLAIQLLLDWAVTRNTATHPDTRGCGESQRSVAPAPTALSLTYEAFVLAQAFPLAPGLVLEPRNAGLWVDAVSTSGELERRRLWHLAYERHYRVGVLDALHAFNRNSSPQPRTPRFQAVFCIDDREESLRRHLEEVLPDTQTMGFAGFFGVAMAYQGLHDVRPRALCPVNINPKHLVREVAVDESVHAPLLKGRARRAAVKHGLSVSARTLVRGSLVTAGLGLAALAPLVGRSLFPRGTRRWFRSSAPSVRTRLLFERAPNSPTNATYLLGYTVTEMADIVAGVLRTLNIAENAAPIVLLMGHGSSSVNNPHCAAYDCGATGGGKGGPNARAFAAMANHPDVRAELARRGVRLPAGTHLVGAYHDTANDTVTYYDTDGIPEGLTPQFDELVLALEKACRLNARERCRRFEHAPLDLGERAAHRHVEERTVDIGQPRPECGHATNSLCIVGRRERTRGLFLDRRAFLVSYDPTSDSSGNQLSALLKSVAPVGAGINLEYYFSFVDPKTYGCGTKLPHNVVGLYGVMDGQTSDLRTGLPWQMVELHEPMRLLTIVEAKCETLQRVLDAEPGVATLIQNGWIALVALDPDSPALFTFRRGCFEPYQPESSLLRTVGSSTAAYLGQRDHLSCARIAQPEATP